MMLVALLVVLVPPLAFGQSWDEWVYRGLALLLIGCPCALVISTPAAVTSALAAATRQGGPHQRGAPRWSGSPTSIPWPLTRPAP